MDREFKEMMFGAMFDELDNLQANRLFTDGELQKEALNVGSIVQGIKGGAKSLSKDPGAFMSRIKGAYHAKAPAGLSGVGKRVGNVLKTDEGKMLAAGVGGAAGVGVAGSLMRPRQ